MAISSSAKAGRSQWKARRASDPRNHHSLSRHGFLHRQRMRIGVQDARHAREATPPPAGLGVSASAFIPPLYADQPTVPKATATATHVWLEGAAWYIQRMRTRPAVANGLMFCSVTFRDALDRSPLKSRVRDTLLEMLHSADAFGRTSVSGRKLAGRLGLREATITSHLEKARRAELLLSKRRYNNSSVHQLTWPGSDFHPPLPGVKPVRGHTWTDGELAWWSSLDTDSPQPPPWGDGRPPF